MSKPAVPPNLYTNLNQLDKALSRIDSQVAFGGITLGPGVIGPGMIGSGVFDPGMFGTGWIDGVMISDGAITADKIFANTITADKIFANTITANQIAANTITANEIFAHTITADLIMAHTITADEILAHTITANEIFANTITANLIAARTITANLIMAHTITANEIFAHTITANEIFAHTITATEIVAGTITAVEIAAGTIVAGNIAGGTITGGKIAAETITATNIAAGTITAGNILAGTITAAQIAAGTITATQIAADTITAGQIAANAITVSELAAGSVSAAKIAAHVITANEIFAGTITSTEIAAGTITGINIASATITSANIAGGTITGSNIAGATITASNISVANLSALSANLGTITSGTVTGATLQTGASGARVVIDSAGFRAYQTDGTTKAMEFKISDGSLAITGALIAGSSIPAGSITGQLITSQISDLAITAQKLGVTMGGANFLTDSSFAKTGLPDWTTGANTTLALNSSVFRPGTSTSSASLTAIALGDTSVANSGNTQRVPVLASVAYSVSAYFRANTTTRSCRVEIGWYNSSNALISTSVGTAVADSNSAWTRVSVTATSPSTAVSAAVISRVISSGAGEIHYVDDAQIEAGDVVTAYAPRPDEILPGWVTGAQIASSTIATGNIIPNAITTSLINDGAVLTAKLADANVTLQKMAANSVDSSQLVANAVTNVKLATDAVASANIQTGAVLTAKLADANVTLAKMAANSVDASQLVANAVTNVKLATDAVASANIQTGAVLSAKIADANITLAKMASNSVDSSKLVDAAVTAAKLGATFGGGNAYIESSPTGTTVGIGWVSDNATATFVTTPSHPITPGSGVAKITKSASAGVTDLYQGSTTRYAVLPNRPFSFSFYIRTDATGASRNAQAQIEWKTAAGSSISASTGLNVATSTTDWTRVTVTGTAPPTAGFARPIALINAAAANEIHYITGLQFELGDVITAYAPKADEILPLTIQTVQIADDAVVSAKIANATITGTDIAATTIAAGNITSGTITTLQIAADTITAGNIAANAIDTTELNASAVTAAKIAANTITAAQIFAGTITTTQIAADTILAGNIAANAITSSELNANSVIAGKIAANAVTTTELAANTITAADIAAHVITANEILAATITATEIAADTIVAGNIAANAITASELNANSVVAGKIAANAVTTNEIAANTITAGDILAHTITANEILAATITATEIAADTITANQIAANAITASELNANAVVAGKIAANAVTANEIAAGSIIATKLSIVSPIGDSLVLDPSFEAATADSTWASFPNDLLGSPTLGSHYGGDSTDGSQCLIMTCTTAQAQSRVSNVMPVNAGETYTVRVKARGSVTTSTGRYITIGEYTSRPASNQVARSSFTHLANNQGFTASWSTYEFTYTVPAGVKFVTLTLLIDRPNLTIDSFWDEAEFRKQFSGVNIENGAITANKITANTITANEIAANAVDTSELNANAVTAAKIAANTITAAQIAATTITGSLIAASTITGGNIAGTTITAANIASGTITATQIQSGTITTTQIAATTILASNIASGTITATQIATDTITANQIAANAIGTTELVAGSVTTSKLNVILGGNNMMTNSGFDDPVDYLSDWNTSSGTPTRELSVVHSNGAAVRFTASGGFAGCFWEPDGKRVRVQQGKVITVSGWIRAPRADSIIIRLLMWTAVSGGTRTSVDAVPDSAVPAGAWARVSGTFTIPGGVVAVGMQVLSWNSVAGDVYYFDDFQIEEGDVATSWNPKADEILPTTITGSMIQANTITGSLISTTPGGKITASNIEALTITAAQIAATTITGGKIAAGTITATNIAGNTITAALIAANTITASEIATGTITSTQIAANTIAAVDIAAGAIGTDQLAAGAITAGKLDVFGTQSENMVMDPSFEGLQVESPWAKYPGSSGTVWDWQFDNNNGTHGNRCLRINNVGPTENAQIASNLIPVTAGDTYAVAYSARAGSATTVGRRVVINEYNTKPTDNTVTRTGSTALAVSAPFTSGFNRYEYTYTVPAGVKYVTVLLMAVTPNIVTNCLYDEIDFRKQISTVHIEGGAIDAMTITGATHRTAAAGSRVEMTSAGLKFYESDGTTVAVDLSSTNQGLNLLAGNTSSGTYIPPRTRSIDWINSVGAVAASLSAFTMNSPVTIYKAELHTWNPAQANQNTEYVAWCDTNGKSQIGLIAKRSDSLTNTLWVDNATDSVQASNASGHTNFLIDDGGTLIANRHAMIGAGSYALWTLSINHAFQPNYPIYVGTDTTNGNNALLTSTGGWTNGSSRSIKENFRDIPDLLGKIERIPIQEWNFKPTPFDENHLETHVDQMRHEHTVRTDRHIGPTADDFYDQFPGVLAASRGSFVDPKGNVMGDKSLNLGISDVAGVALGGVKELIALVKQMRVEIDYLRAKVEAV